MPIDSIAQNSDPDDIGAKAIEIAKKIENDWLVAGDDWVEVSLSDASLTSSARLRLMRKVYMDSIAAVSTPELQNIAKKYEVLASTEGTKRDQAIAELFLHHVKHNENNLDQIHQVQSELTGYLDSPDWFVRHRALNLIVGSMTDLSNANFAMHTAQEALNVIPDGQSNDYTLEAQALSLEYLVFLQNILKNRELAIEQSNQLIALEQSRGETIDGVSLINNLIYSFSAWRDHEIADQLIQILLRIESKGAQSTPGLTHMRASVIKNELAEYEEAFQYANLAINSAEHALIKKSAEQHKIIALAGMGKLDDANIAFEKFYESLSSTEKDNSTIRSNLLHAEALIALHSDQKFLAEKLYNKRVDIKIRQLLESANQQTASKLAALQNTQDRQAEREAAFQRESELQKEALDKQAQSNRLLTVLLAVLSAAAIAALAFARFRSKVAKKLKISAEQAEAGEKSKSEFLALMSHELRTPLNGIIGLADFLADQAPTPDLREKNAVILNSGHELLSLVENILDMTLIEAGEMKTFAEPTVLRPLLEECISNWKQSIERKGIAYTAHIDPSVPDIMTVDPKRLMQCINNLLSNAAKFTSKGRVHVHILGKDLKDNQAELQVIVADTGVGITEAAQGRMFQAFVQADTSMTRHYGGAGLGLAITKNLAQYMGGDVTVTSKNGRGSEFILTVRGETDTLVESATPEIPSLSGAVPVPVIAPAPEAQRRVPRRILAVDDDVSSHDVLRTLLEPSDCKLVCVPNGQFALEALKENLFDLILMDIRMPAMNGIEATRSIRNSGKPYADIPIVAVTADVAPETQEMCLAAGVDEFVAKPVSIKALLEAFDRLDPDRVDIREAS